MARVNEGLHSFTCHTLNSVSGTPSGKSGVDMSSPIHVVATSLQSPFRTLSLEGHVYIRAVYIPLTASEYEKVAFLTIDTENDITPHQAGPILLEMFNCMCFCW